MVHFGWNSIWIAFEKKRTFSGRKATVRHINKCYATQEYTIHHDVFSQSCLFLNMHHILLCVMHGVVALTSPVTIIKYAGGMVSWNIYYNNLHRRSSAKTSRIAPKLRKTQREKKAWTEQIPAIKKIMMSVQRAELRISDLFNIVPFVNERHPSQQTMPCMFDE